MANCKTEHGYERGPFDACTTQEDEGDEKVTSKRSRTSVLTRTRAHQQTAVPGSLKWMVIAAPGVAFLLLVERLGMAQPTHTSPRLMQKHLTIIKRSSQALLAI